MDAPTLRIDAPLIPSHQGRLVRIIGKCLDKTTLDSNGHVSLSTDESLKVNLFYEIIGKVSTGDVVNVYSVVELSENIDMNVVKKLVEYVAKVPELF